MNEKSLRSYLATGDYEPSEDAAPRNPEFEEKHPRGNTRTGHKGQFRKSEKTLARLDEADAAAGQIRTDGGEVPEVLTAKEMADLEAHFGTTEDIKAAGWLLPNGSLLDFNRDYHDQEKSDWVEHGEIGWYLSDERKKAAGISEESRKKDLDALTRGRESASRAGAIRFDNYPQGLSIDIYREPSAAQYQQLEVLAHHNWWQDMDGGHMVDFGNGQTMTYPDNETLAKRLVADVKRHFSGSDENADAYAVRMFHSTEDASPMNLKKIASLALAEDAAAKKTKPRFNAGDSVQLPIKHWPNPLPGEMGEVIDIDEKKGVYLVEFDETGITDPIPFSCLDEYGIKYIDGAPVEDAAPKSFDIYKDFDQNLFEWGAIREINRIRRAVAAKPKDSVVTDEEFVELNKPFHEAAKRYIADNGFSPDKQWVKDTVLSVPKALANAFDTLSDGEGVSREHFLEVLTVEAICALAIGAVDSVRAIEDYYGKHKFKRDSDGDVLFHAPDFETPVTVEDASDSVDMLLTSDLHTTDLDTLDPKDARIVVIAGDIMGGGMDSDDAGREYLEQKFFPWCREHADKEIVVTAGNHDKFLFRQWVKGRKLNWPSNVHYVVDTPTTIHGIKFFGTPWCLKDRPGRFEGDEEYLKERFEKIPKGLDVLISHSPPYIPGNQIDANEDGLHEGSKELTEAILKKKPRYCVCGHVHSGSRTPAKIGDTIVYNVARVKEDRSTPSCKPVFLNIPKK